jgi:hypothetical protein
MYIMIVSDAPALPVDLCIASAMLGHAAWAFRPEEFASLRGGHPSLILLDLSRSADITASVAIARDRFPGVGIVLLGSEPAASDGKAFLRLPTPITADGLREIMRQATDVAA